jgi:hypothetical protein
MGSIESDGVRVADAYTFWREEYDRRDQACEELRRRSQTTQNELRRAEAELRDWIRRCPVYSDDQQRVVRSAMEEDLRRAG